MDREKIIKGLEKCKCCECDDCTEKDASQAPWDCPAYDDFVDSAIAMLKEQEPKMGKWILNDEDANSWECSECGDLTLIIDGTPHENGWYFCPHCGTKLKEQTVK